MNETRPEDPSSAGSLTVYFALERFLGLFCGEGAQWNYGGAEMQMYYLARSFAALPATRVVLLTTQAGYTSIYPGITIQQIKKPPHTGNIIVRMRQKHVPAPLVWAAEKLIKRANRVRRRKLFEDRSEQSVLLLSSFEKLEIVEAAHIKGLKLVYRISGDSLVDGSYAPETFTRTYIDHLLDLSDAVVVQSEHQQHTFAKNYGRDSTVIASSFAWEDLPSAPAARKKQVLWIGRCVAIKRPWLVLELAHRLPQAHFVLIAPPAPDDELYQEIEREAQDLENVTLIPGLARNEILQCYLESSVVINTSFSEGMPNTLIEACATETPYVSYRLDINGLLGEGGIGDCAHEDFESFVDLVSQYLDSDEKRAEAGRKASEYARNTWSIQTATEAYIKLFEELQPVERTRS